MSLFSRSLVRGLRRRARIETKLHPQWKIEARAARKSSQRVTRSHFRWAVPLAATGLAASDAGASLAMPIVLAWSAALMFARAAQIQALFFSHSESTPFCQFPVTESFVFQHASRRLLRSSLWLVADVLFFLATVASRIRPPEAIAESLLLALFAAIGIWAATLGGAITLVWIRPGFPFGMVSRCAFSFGWIGIWVATSAKLLTPAAIHAAYESVKWCVPPGWVCVLIEPWLRADRAPFIAPLFLLAGLTVATVTAAHRLRRAFAFWPPHLEPDRSGEAWPDEAPAPRTSEIEDAIASRSFLTGRDWTRGGFIERTAARWLTPREQRVMDLALTQAPGWTRRFLQACLLVLAAPCLAWLARGAVAQPGWILGLGTLAGLGLITPIFGGGWSAFTLVPLAHRATAICNTWPVSLRELRGCVLKLNLTRYLFALPCWLFAGGGGAAFFGDPIYSGVVIAGKCWLLALALQPFFLTFKYSASTNDTSSGCLFIVAVFALGLAVVAAALTTAMLCLDADKFAQWLIACAALAILSWLLEMAYRRAWRAQQFDLLAKSGSDAFV